jgi:hypothetical protein
VLGFAACARLLAAGRPVACGLWPVACGLWPVAGGSLIVGLGLAGLTVISADSASLWLRTIRTMLYFLL